MNDMAARPLSGPEPSPDQSPGQAPAVAAPSSFGRALAQERERRGLSAGDIATRLRLHPKQIASIEQDDLVAFPAPFLRGFVRNYAKELQLDPAPLLKDLNARLTASGDRDELSTGSGAPTGERAAVYEQLPRRLVMIGALTVLVAFGVIGWLATRPEPSAPVVEKKVAPPIAAVPLEPLASPPSTEPVQNVPVPSEPAEIAVAPAKAAARGKAIRLRFSDSAWVEVSQGDGSVLSSQLNGAGTEQNYDGKRPFKLVIGNAPAVSLEYNGKAVDLKPLTRADNVARVTLN